MKITHMTAVQGLLLLAACLPAAAQADVNPDHFRDEPSTQISASAPDSQIRALEVQLKAYQQELAAKSELVEKARQEAISAGIQGDGAAPFIDACTQEEKEMEALLASLSPKMEQTRALIASLNNSVSPADSSLSQVQKPAQRVSSVASNSHQRKESDTRIIASRAASGVNPRSR